MTATKTAPVNQHAQALQQLQRCRDWQDTEMADATAEAEEAERVYAEWDAPRRRRDAAKQRMENVTKISARNLETSRQRAIELAAPAIAKEIRRLSNEIMTIGSLFRSWVGGNNAEDCNAYRVSCQRNLERLRALQLEEHTEASAEEEIRRLRRDSAPRPDQGI